MVTVLNLKWDFSFEDLYRRDALARLDEVFLNQLDSALRDRLLQARATELTRKQNADLLVDLAPHLEDFIGDLFGISAEVRALQAKHSALEPLFALKRKFIHKKAISGVTESQAAAHDGPALAAELE